MIVKQKSASNSWLFAQCVGMMLLLNVVRLLILLRSHSLDWYKSLDKPYFDPPVSFFGPLTLINYACIGVALYLVIISKLHRDAKKMAYVSFGAHLTASFMWPIFLFVMRAPWLAFADSLIAVVTIIWAMREVNYHHDWAMYFLMPQMIAVSFYSFLNVSIALLLK